MPLRNIDEVFALGMLSKWLEEEGLHWRWKSVDLIDWEEPNADSGKLTFKYVMHWAQAEPQRNPMRVECVIRYKGSPGSYTYKQDTLKLYRWHTRDGVVDLTIKFGPSAVALPDMP